MAGTPFDESSKLRNRYGSRELCQQVNVVFDAPDLDGHATCLCAGPSDCGVNFRARLVVEQGLSSMGAPYEVDEQSYVLASHEDLQYGVTQLRRTPLLVIVG